MESFPKVHGRAPALLLTAAAALSSCNGPQTAAASGDADKGKAPLGPGEFGWAVAGGAPCANIAKFDTLDFDVFSNRKWDRLSESPADDIIVTWPDGHDTKGMNGSIGTMRPI